MDIGGGESITAEHQTRPWISNHYGDNERAMGCVTFLIEIKGTTSLKRQLSVDSYSKGIDTPNGFTQATGMTIALCHGPQKKNDKV